jgi:hypothetical protein
MLGLEEPQAPARHAVGGGRGQEGVVAVAQRGQAPGRQRQRLGVDGAHVAGRGGAQGLEKWRRRAVAQRGVRPGHQRRAVRAEPRQQGRQRGGGGVQRGRAGAVAQRGQGPQQVGGAAVAHGGGVRGEGGGGAVQEGLPRVELQPPEGPHHARQLPGRHPRRGAARAGRGGGQQPRRAVVEPRKAGQRGGQGGGGERLQPAVGPGLHHAQQPRGLQAQLPKGGHHAQHVLELGAAHRGRRPRGDGLEERLGGDARLGVGARNVGELAHRVGGGGGGHGGCQAEQQGGRGGAAAGQGPQHAGGARGGERSPRRHAGGLILAKRRLAGGPVERGHAGGDTGQLRRAQRRQRAAGAQPRRKRSEEGRGAVVEGGQGLQHPQDRARGQGPRLRRQRRRQRRQQRGVPAAEPGQRLERGSQGIRVQTSAAVACIACAAGERGGISLQLVVQLGGGGRQRRGGRAGRQQRQCPQQLQRCGRLPRRGHRRQRVDQRPARLAAALAQAPQQLRGQLWRRRLHPRPPVDSLVGHQLLHTGYG